MKPIQVEAGQFAPDVDEIVEKAGSMIEKLEMDNSQIHNITGVEPAPMTHYYTNQNQPTDIEEVTNKGGSGPENVTHIDANPHQTGSTLSVHENTAGGEGGLAESSARYGAGSSGVRKGIEEILGKKPPGMGKPPLPGMDEGGPGMGKPPLPGMDDGPPGMDDDGPPGMDDDDDDAETLGDRIKSLVDKLVDKSGDGGMGDGPLGLPKGPPPGGPPPGGPPMPPGGGGPPGGPPMM